MVQPAGRGRKFSDLRVEPGRVTRCSNSHRSDQIGSGFFHRISRVGSGHPDLIPTREKRRTRPVRSPGYFCFSCFGGIFVNKELPNVVWITIVYFSLLFVYAGFPFGMWLA